MIDLTRLQQVRVRPARKWVATGLGVLLGAGLLATSVGVTAAQSASNTPIFYGGNGWQEGAPINEFNNNGLPLWGVDIDPLAFTLLSLTKMQPAIAKSWTLSPNGRVLTVQLNPKAGFSNGQPVTAADVKAAWALMFIEGWVTGDGTAQVNVLGPRTVQFVRFPAPNVAWVTNVLNQGIVAPFAYEQAGLLPKNIWTTIYQSLYNGTNKADLKLAATAQAAMSKLAVKIAALKITKDISDGPWTLKTFNTGEEIFVRNPHFFNNSQNHLNEVIFRNNDYSAQQVFNQAVAGAYTYFTGALPPNVEKAVLRVPGEHVVFQQIAEFCGVIFNEHDYPYNMLAVRQALAYLINRQNIQKIAEPTTGTPVKYLTGMEDTQAQQWLPKSVLASLNPYQNNPAKAASLLTKAGFKKVAGKWIMPNGKPFTMQIQVEAGYPDYDEAATVMQNELDLFGIPTKVYQDNLAQYATYQQNGDYAVSFSPLGGGDVIYPQPAYASVYYNYDGWTTHGTKVVRLKLGGQLKNGSVTGSSTVAPREEDIPSVLNVPGVGRVEPAVLSEELNSVTSHTQQVNDYIKLAKTTNYWLPILPLFDQSQTAFYNTTNFTDWPPASSYLHDLNNVAYSFSFWAQYGWIHPKH